MQKENTHLHTLELLTCAKYGNENERQQAERELAISSLSHPENTHPEVSPVTLAPGFGLSDVLDQLQGMPVGGNMSAMPAVRAK